MPYPGPKIHRVARRRLGRGQHSAPEPITVTVMGSGYTVRVAFSRPVTVKGPINFLLANNTLLSQTVTGPQTLDLLYTSFISSDPWSLPSPVPNTFSATGATILGAAGTDMLSPNDVLHTAGGNYFPPPPTSVQLNFQFGVNGTSETGTYNPTTPPKANAISFVNNGDGTYNVSFDQNWQAFNFNQNGGILLFIPGTGEWTPIANGGTVDPTTIVLFAAGLDATATAAVFIGAADNLSFPNGLTLGAPIS